MIGRVAALLRSIADSDGQSTSTLARRTGLARPTVHRLLGSLADEGFVDRSRTTGGWSLGPELYLLGATASVRYDITSAASDILRDLARQTGESAYLSARRGDETVCIAEEEGSFPLRSHVLHPGIRFPLGVASAGLVILATMPDRDVAEYVERTDLVPVWGAHHSTSELMRRVAATRIDGYATNPALLVDGSWGMAAAVFDSRGEPAWAVSLTGVETRFADDRRAELGAALLVHAHRLTLRLSGRRG